jgi:hypothetical protein
MSQYVLAQDSSQESRILKTYQITDKLYDIDCYVFKPIKNILVNPLNKTRYFSKKLERDFNIDFNNQSINISVSLSAHPKSEAQYEVVTSTGESFVGVIDTNFKKGFYLEPKISNATINKFELNRLYCKVNFAESTKTIIDDSSKRLHINVHPHSNYDVFSETVKYSENLHRKFKSILLLEEDIDGKGNLVDLSSFLETGISSELPISLYSTLLKIPETTELIVSAAGHNRYQFSSNLENIEINYTGGNHNYCIWNNTRKLLTAWLRSYNSSSLTVNYHTKGIVAQRVGIIGGLSFKRKSMKSTRLLRSIFDNDLKTAGKYIVNYNNYFTSSFINRNGLSAHYKTLTISTISTVPFVKKEIILKGNGARDLKLSFNYL